MLLTNVILPPLSVTPFALIVVANMLPPLRVTPPMKFLVVDTLDTLPLIFRTEPEADSVTTPPLNTNSLSVAVAELIVVARIIPAEIVPVALIEVTTTWVPEIIPRSRVTPPILFDVVESFERLPLIFNAPLLIYSSKRGVP